MGWGVGADLISEAAIIFFEAIQKHNRLGEVHFDNHMIANFLVDFAIGPIFSVGTFCYLTAHRPDIDNYHKSTATVMTALIIRHLFKKFLDCCPTNTSDKRDKNQVSNENKGNERDRLLPNINADYLADNNHNDGADNANTLDKKTPTSFCDYASAFVSGFFYHGNHIKKAPPHSNQANINPPEVRLPPPL